MYSVNDKIMLISFILTPTSTTIKYRNLIGQSRSQVTQHWEITKKREKSSTGKIVTLHFWFELLCFNYNSGISVKGKTNFDLPSLRISFGPISCTFTVSTASWEGLGRVALLLHHPSCGIARGLNWRLPLWHKMGWTKVSCCHERWRKFPSKTSLAHANYPK